MDYIAITNYSWWKFLALKKIVDRINFWATTTDAWANGLEGGTIFFLCKDTHRVVGWGTYLEMRSGSVARAWAVLGERNGAHSLKHMLDLMNESGHVKNKPLTENSVIGCNIITNVTWLDTPINPLEREVIIKPRTQRGRTLSPAEAANLLAVDASQVRQLLDNEKGGVTKQREAARRPRVHRELDI